MHQNLLINNRNPMQWMPVLPLPESEPDPFQTVFDDSLHAFRLLYAILLSASVLRLGTATTSSTLYVFLPLRVLLSGTSSISQSLFLPPSIPSLDDIVDITVSSPRRLHHI